MCIRDSSKVYLMTLHRLCQTQVFDLSSSCGSGIVFSCFERLVAAKVIPWYPVTFSYFWSHPPDPTGMYHTLRSGGKYSQRGIFSFSQFSLLNSYRVSLYCLLSVLWCFGFVSLVYSRSGLGILFPSVLQWYSFTFLAYCSVRVLFSWCILWCLSLIHIWRCRRS